MVRFIAPYKLWLIIYYFSVDSVPSAAIVIDDFLLIIDYFIFEISVNLQFFVSLWLISVLQIEI